MQSCSVWGGPQRAQRAQRVEQGRGLGREQELERGQELEWEQELEREQEPEWGRELEWEQELEWVLAQLLLAVAGPV